MRNVAKLTNHLNAAVLASFLLFVTGCNEDTINCAIEIQNAMAKAEEEVSSSERFNDYSDFQLKEAVHVYAKGYMDSRCLDKHQENRYVNIETQINAPLIEESINSEKQELVELPDPNEVEKISIQVEAQESRLNFPPSFCIPHEESHPRLCDRYTDLAEERFQAVINDPEFKKITAYGGLQNQVEKVFWKNFDGEFERDWAQEYEDLLLRNNYSEILNRLSDLGHPLHNYCRSDNQSTYCMDQQEFNIIKEEILPKIDVDIKNLIDNRQHLFSEFQQYLIDSEKQAQVVIADYKRTIVEEEAKNQEIAHQKAINKKKTESQKTQALHSDGFRGIVWGSDFSKYGSEMVLYEESPVLFAPPDTIFPFATKSYHRNGDKQSIGDIQINQVGYGFHEGKFYEVSFTTKNEESIQSDFETLVSAMKSKYGRPTGESGSLVIWDKDDIFVSVEWVVSPDVEVIVRIISTKTVIDLVNKKRKEQENKGAKIVDDM